MRGGEQFATGFLHIHGITHKQTLFVNSWGTSKQVYMCYSLRALLVDFHSLTDYSTYDFGRGNIPINMAYVWCRGTESTLAECVYES